MPPALNLECRACGSRLALRPGPRASARARECLACPVCWAVGPALEEAEADDDHGDRGADRDGQDGQDGPDVERPVISCKSCASLSDAVVVELGRSDSYRLLGCIRPDGPELEGEPRPIRELARTLWRLAGG